MKIKNDYYGDFRNLFDDEKDLNFYPILAPGEFKDVILNKNSHGQFSNIAKRFRLSESINWGYYGTGPLDLALNTLIHFSGDDLDFTNKYYHDFTTDILKDLPQEPVVISSEFILNWIMQAKTKEPDHVAREEIPCGSDYYYDHDFNLIKREKKKPLLTKTPLRGENGGYYGK